jgi:hypothetical protein
MDHVNSTADSLVVADHADNANSAVPDDSRVVVYLERVIRLQEDTKAKISSLEAGQRALLKQLTSEEPVAGHSSGLQRSVSLVQDSEFDESVPLRYTSAQRGSADSRTQDLEPERSLPSLHALSIGASRPLHASPVPKMAMREGPLLAGASGLPSGDISADPEIANDDENQIKDDRNWAVTSSGQSTFSVPSLKDGSSRESFKSSLRASMTNSEDVTQTNTSQPTSSDSRRKIGNSYFFEDGDGGNRDDVEDDIHGSAVCELHPTWHKATAAKTHKLAPSSSKIGADIFRRSSHGDWDGFGRVHSLLQNKGKKKRYPKVLDRIVLSPSSQLLIVWSLMEGYLLTYDMIAIPASLLDPPQSMFDDAMRWASLVFWS